ncbi:MAG: serine hydrolase domain-containing protein [Sphaerochaetaceae bacterium]|jgi:D-alanyl-D-alanine carboxypeptidase|nr:serine hydrolase domain-containing protein [Sphaerochaetaceae bacterium]
MNNHKIRISLILVCVCAIFLSSCTTQTGSNSDTEQLLQEMINQHYLALKEGLTLPEQLGMLLYVQTPKESYTVQSGFAGQQYSSETHYRIASVTKTFTAASVMLLEQEGKLHIEDSVSANIPGTGLPYLPDDEDYAIPYRDRITIKDLLSHRAGIFDVFNDPIPADSKEPYAGMNYIAYIQDTEGDDPHQYTLAELASVIAKDQLTYGEPGTQHHYSDSGYMLLATIIERVSNMTYGQFLHQRFFAPLGMTFTSAPDSARDTKLDQPYFEGYARWDAQYFNATEDNMSSNIGAGNIVSTPKDMAHWISSLLTGHSSLSMSQIDIMKTIPEGNTNYALGLSKSPIGIGHSGAHPGYLNFVQYHEESGISLVLVAPFIDYDEGNMDHVAATSQVMLDIMKDALEICSR